MTTASNKFLKPSDWIYNTPIAPTPRPFPFPHPPLFPPALPSPALLTLLSDPSSVSPVQLQALDAGCLWRRINLLIYDLSNFAHLPPSVQRLQLLPDRWGDFFSSPYFTALEGELMAALPVLPGGMPGEGRISGRSAISVLGEDIVADGVDGKDEEEEDDDAEWEIVHIVDAQEEEAPQGTPTPTPTATATAKPTTTLRDAILHILSPHVPGSDYRFCAARQIASLLRRAFDIHPKHQPRNVKFDDLCRDSGTRLSFGEVWTGALGQGDRRRKHRGNVSAKVATRVARKLEGENDICCGPCYLDQGRLR